jgi:hypothetical protein
MSSLIQTSLSRPTSRGPLAPYNLVYVSYKVRTSFGSFWFLLLLGRCHKTEGPEGNVGQTSRFRLPEFHRFEVTGIVFSCESWMNWLGKSWNKHNIIWFCPRASFQMIYIARKRRQILCCSFVLEVRQFYSIYLFIVVSYFALFQSGGLPWVKNNAFVLYCLSSFLILSTPQTRCHKNRPVFLWIILDFIIFRWNILFLHFLEMWIFSRFWQFAVKLVVSVFLSKVNWCWVSNFFGGDKLKNKILIEDIPFAYI